MLSKSKNPPRVFVWKDPGGEYVAFTRGAVTAEGPVESWLSKVEQAMRDALYDNAKKAVNEYPKSRDESIIRDKWLWEYPAQVRARLLSVGSKALGKTQQKSHGVLWVFPQGPV